MRRLPLASLFVAVACTSTADTDTDANSGAGGKADELGGECIFGDSLTRAKASDDFEVGTTMELRPGTTLTDQEREQVLLALQTGGVVTGSLPDGYSKLDGGVVDMTTLRSLETDIGGFTLYEFTVAGEAIGVMYYDDTFEVAAVTMGDEFEECNIVFAEDITDNRTDQCIFGELFTITLASDEFRVEDVQTIRSDEGLSELTREQILIGMAASGTPEATTVDAALDFTDDHLFHVETMTYKFAGGGRYTLYSWHAGDNPQDFIFKEGTLELAAVVGDDCVHQCTANHSTGDLISSEADQVITTLNEECQSGEACDRGFVYEIMRIECGTPVETCLMVGNIDQATNSVFDGGVFDNEDPLTARGDDWQARIYDDAFDTDSDPLRFSCQLDSVASVMDGEQPSAEFKAHFQRCLLGLEELAMSLL